MDRTKKYAEIHIKIKECGLTEEQYRNMLEKEFYVTTSKELSDFEISQLLTILYKMSKLKKQNDKISNQQKNYIKSLLLKSKINNLIGFCNTLFKRKIESLDNLTTKEASKLIVILKK